MSQNKSEEEWESMLKRARARNAGMQSPEIEESMEFQEAVFRAKARRVLYPNLTEEEENEREWKEALDSAPLRPRRTEGEEIMGYRQPRQPSQKPRYAEKAPEPKPTPKPLSEIPQPEFVEPAENLGIVIPGVIVDDAASQEAKKTEKAKQEKSKPKEKPASLESIVAQQPQKQPKAPRFMGQRPDLFSFGLLFEDLGVVGQKRAIYRGLLNMISGTSFIYVGPSGGGKTITADALISLLPRELVYELNDSKNNALFEHAERFTGRVLYFPEIQTFLRGSSNEKDAFRTMCEGRPYIYFGKEGEEKVLEPLLVVSAVAESNKYWQRYLMDDPEFKSRVDLIYIDKSLSSLMEQRIARNVKRAGLSRRKESVLTREQASAFLADRMTMRIDGSIIDPSSAFMDRYFPFTFVANRYTSHYRALEDALLKWHIDEDTYEANGKMVFILGLRNKYRAERIARDNICAALRAFDNVTYAREELKWSEEEIKELEKSIERSKQAVDWQACWESYLESLRSANAPPELISEVINRHIVNGKLTVQDPITGETVVLAEYPKVARREDIVVTDLSGRFQQEPHKGKAEDDCLDLYAAEDGVITPTEESMKTPKLFPAPKETAGQESQRKKYEFQGNAYDSMEEAACAALMQKYIPCFEPVEGETLHVKEDIPGTIDFKVNGAFVEYHPILFFRDFETEDEFEAYKAKRDGTPEKKRKEFDAGCRRRLASGYFAKRASAINQSPTYEGTELILVTSSEELYDNVVSRFGRNIPSKGAFLQEFNEVKAQVRECNPQAD